MISIRVSAVVPAIVLSFASLQAGFTSCASVSENISSLGKSVASRVAQENKARTAQKSAVEVLTNSSRKMVAVPAQELLEIAKHAELMEKVTQDADLIRDLAETLKDMCKRLNGDATVSKNKILAQARKLAFLAAKSKNNDVLWLARCVQRTGESVSALPNTPKEQLEQDIAILALFSEDFVKKN